MPWSAKRTNPQKYTQKSGRMAVAGHLSSQKTLVTLGMPFRNPATTWRKIWPEERLGLKMRRKNLDQQHHGLVGDVATCS